MNFNKHPLHQSLISRFLYHGDERENICPRQIYNQSIIKKYPYVSEPMVKGMFFETLALGSASGNRIIDDLPRKALSKKQQTENEKRKELKQAPIKGEKRVDQVRIETQAARFKRLCAKYQVTVFENNTQVPIIIPWHKNKDVLLAMELDIFPTAIMTEEGLKMAIIDLKLTAKLDSTFGEYSWGSPQYMDHIQAKMYHYGVRQIINNVERNEHLKDILTKPVMNLILNNKIKFYYWVFEYKKEEMRDKLIEYEWDSEKEAELHESIRKTINLIEYYEQQEWPAAPDYSLCKECTVLNCDKKQTIQTI